MFYDWIYINALYKNKEIFNELIKYNAFTDIEFNPNKANIENLKYKPEKLENGYMVQNILEYLEYLKSSSREKDKARIPLVEKYMEGQE